MDRARFRRLARRRFADALRVADTEGLAAEADQLRARLDACNAEDQARSEDRDFDWRPVRSGGTAVPRDDRDDSLPTEQEIRDALGDPFVLRDLADAIAEDVERLRGYGRPTRAQREQLATAEQLLVKVNAARREHDAATDRGRDRLLDALRGGHVVSGSSHDGDNQHSITARDQARLQTGSGAGGNRPGRLYGSAERDAARRVLDDAVRNRRLPEHAAEKAEGLILHTGTAREQALAGQWVQAAGAPAYSSAFAKMFADPVRGHMTWDDRERAAYARVEEVRTALGLGTGGGSSMVPFDLDPAIMLTNDGSNNPLRQIARVVQTASDSWNGVTSEGATAEWKDEHAEAADGTPALVGAQIPVHLGDVDVIYSYEIGMDALSFLDEIRKVIVDAVDNLQAEAFTNGTDPLHPSGVVPGATETVNTVGAFTADTVVNVQNDLPARFSGNARWVAHLAVLNEIESFETTNGHLRFPSIQADPPRLLRKPVHENSHMGSSFDVDNDEILLYGDFAQGFVIADRIGTTLELLPGYGPNQRPTAQRHAFATFRTGSSVVVPDALRKLVKSS